MSKLHTLLDVLTEIWLAIAVIDGVRVRWKHKRYLADAAEAALAGRAHVVDGVTLPDPSDLRWRNDRRIFITTSGKETPEETVLVLGEISVSVRDQAVYVGAGVSLHQGQKYACAVIRAYRQRVVDKSTK